MNTVYLISQLCSFISGLYNSYRCFFSKQLAPLSTVLNNFGEINPTSPVADWNQLADTIEDTVASRGLFRDQYEKRTHELLLFTLIWHLVIRISDGPTVLELYDKLLKALSDATLARSSMYDSQQRKDMLVLILCMFPLNEGLRLFYSIDSPKTEGDRLLLKEVEELYCTYSMLRVINAYS